MFFCGVFRDVRAGAACLQAQAFPSCRGVFFIWRKFFRSRESGLFFFAGFFAMCVQAQLACWRRLAPRAGAGFFYLTEVFRSRESGLFFLQVFSRCACRRSLPAGAGLPLRPGRALPFLTKRKEAKIRQGGSFDSLPLGTPTQRPKALPLETGRSSRSGSVSRTGTACA